MAIPTISIYQYLPQNCSKMSLGMWMLKEFKKKKKKYMKIDYSVL